MKTSVGFENLVNKKVARGMRRMFFRVHLRTDFERRNGCVVTFQLNYGPFVLYYGKVQLNAGKEFNIFYVDVPVWRYRLGNRISWQVRGYRVYEGEILKTNKFEALV